MEVEIIYATPNPIEKISKAAGTSYGKDDISFKRVKHCFDEGHMGVFEHVGATFHISGISRACSHQLVRHRIASFVQKSQRYTEINPEEDWYVTPPSFDRKDGAGIYMKPYFDEVMGTCIEEYEYALKNGIKPEDARYLLPEATKTDVTMTMNLNSLFHFFDLRRHKRAQWEIRDLANLIMVLLSGYNDDWKELISLYSSKENLKEKVKRLERENEELKDRVWEALEDDFR